MKRTPLSRRTPLRAKREAPRRNEGRVQAGRMKSKAVSKTALEKRHLERIAGLPCIVSGKRPVVVHHLMIAPGKERRRDHRWVVPLVNDLHRNDAKDSVHGLGTEAKFEAHHRLKRGFLIEQAARLWEETCELA